MTSFASIPDVLDFHTSVRPNAVAYHLIGGPGLPDESITFAELASEAERIASQLFARDLGGKTVVLAHPTGREFLVSLFGALRAGCAVAPIAFSRSPRASARFHGMIAAADPAAIFGADAFKRAVRGTSIEHLVVTPQELSAPLDTENASRPGRHTTAILQFTSGSSAAPKAVQVTHGNLIDNARVLGETVGVTDLDVTVSWLPLYHDMGLVGGVFAPMFAGGVSVLLPPSYFLQQPEAWLRAMSDFGGSIGLSPNFGYQLCVDRISTEMLAGVDLSQWRVAFCGAEPVRAATLEAFSERFAPVGFSSSAFMPAYGMAEATLLVSGGPPGRGARILDLDRRALEEQQIARPASHGQAIRRVVCCGRPHSEQTLLIVDPDTRQVRRDGEIGEIWISGPHVTAGYRAADPAASDAFKEVLEGADDERGYLRTGDLGFVFEGELIVTGRLKDLIIVHGVNHHPEDIEETAQASHSAFHGLATAAFTRPNDALDEIVIVQETRVQPGEDLKLVAQTLRAAIAKIHGLGVASIHLVRPQSIPRTTSGKVRRRATADLLEAVQIVAIFALESLATSTAKPESDDRPMTSTEAVLAEVLAEILQLDHVGPDDNAFELGFGLDSIAAAQAVFEVSRKIGMEVSLSALFEHPTISGLAAHLDAERAQGLGSHTEVPDLPLAAYELDQEFPLNEIQQAYLIGRDPSLPLGGVGAHAYREMAVVDFDLERFEMAVNRLVARHEMLRTIILPHGAQKVLAQAPHYAVACEDLSSLEEVAACQRLAEIRDGMSHEVYGLGTWPMFGLRLTRLPDGARLHLSLDLLISDVWSANILADELRRLYANPDVLLAPLDVTFRTHLAHQQAKRGSAARARALDYWRDRLADFPTGPDLPLASRSEPLRKPRFVRLERRIATADWAELKSLARRIGVTSNALLISLFCRVLAQWSASSRFAVTLTVSNRLPIHPDIQSIVGEFTSLVLLEYEHLGDRSAASAARAVQERLWHDLDHISVGGVDVIRELTQSRGAAHIGGSPIVFTSTLVETAGRVEDDPLTAFGPVVAAISQTPQVWLDHQVMEDRGDLLFNWDYVPALFPEGMMDDMFASYGDLLDRLAARPDLAHQPAAMALPASQADVRAKANATAGDLVEDLLHGRFERMAMAFPDRVAVVSGGAEISYGDLRARAHSGAVELARAGVEAGDVVAIHLPKGPDQIVAALAVLYAQGVYLPVSDAWPEARVDLVLRQAGVKCVVVSNDHAPAEHLMPFRPIPLTLDEVGATEVALAADPDALAYVIYTSGSTGTPKGVMITHRAALNTLVDVERRFGLGPADRVLAVSALTFDLSVYDIFATLGRGARVIIPPSGAEREPAMWLELIAAQGVTVWNSAPPLMELLAEHATARQVDLRSLRLVLLSGDWIPLALPRAVKMLAPAAKVVSLGGATEAAVWSNFHIIDDIAPDWVSIPYGKPLANQTLHIVDANLEPRPTFAVGDLLIGGAGLAAGYLGDPQLTDERFIRSRTTGDRLYRTGDIGRYLPDGSIEFLGRRDGQVKISGQRVETGELEHALLGHPSVSGAVVMAHGEARSSKRLIAFVTTNGPFEEGEIRRSLQSSLPAALQPARIQWVSAFPLSENGKVDRALLLAGLPKERDTPSGLTGGEQALADQIRSIVEETLGLAAAPGENLLRLGATSIDIIRIGNALLRELDFYPSIESVFEDPTVEALARACAAQRTSEFVPMQARQLLDNDADREAAKAAWRASRGGGAGASRRLLPGATGDVMRAKILKAGSVRRFGAQPVSMEAVGGLLACLAEHERDGRAQLLYGSAGGVYPVIAYLHIKSGRVGDLSAGYYRYDPLNHALSLVQCAAEPEKAYVFPDNADLQHAAAFVIFLVSELAALEPLYGDQALRFCHLEAGAMGQLLAEEAHAHDLGLCHMGSIDLQQVRAQLDLSPTAQVSACLAGGIRSPLSPSVAVGLVAQLDGVELEFEEGEI